MCKSVADFIYQKFKWVCHFYILISYKSSEGMEVAKQKQSEWIFKSVAVVVCMIININLKKKEKKIAQKQVIIIKT